MSNKKMILMYVLSFLAMFVTSYSTLATFDHFNFSLNKFYMAILMTSCMGIINTLVMGNMYKDKRIRFGILGFSLFVAIVSLSLIRIQGFVGDKEFLTSMIPHHSAAIQVCENAKLNDEDNKELCKQIIEAQEKEIEIMQNTLESY